MPISSVNQKINFKNAKNIQLYIKREDALHPHISGNKFRKLKYNLLDAKSKGFKTLLTFGGAYSNHITALSYVGYLHKFNTIGVIRGEELSSHIQTNPTLNFAQRHGMQLQFVSRATYRQKTTSALVKALQGKYGNFYLIPEGGTNALAVKGCEEILTKSDAEFDYVCSSVGTGGTLSGLVNASKPSQQVIGFLALNHPNLDLDIRKFATETNWKLISDYHFGGYAKVSPKLINFINSFNQNNNVPLDPVYTGKMLYGIMDLIEKNYFKPNTKILAIHTGGLQGIAGMNLKLKAKGSPLINV